MANIIIQVFFRGPQRFIIILTEVHRDRGVNYQRSQHNSHAGFSCALHFTHWVNLQPVSVYKTGNKSERIPPLIQLC